MTIKVGDVDAAYEEAQQRGYEIVRPITTDRGASSVFVYAALMET